MKLIKSLGMQYPQITSKEKKRFGIYECPNCNEEFRCQTSLVKTKRTTQSRNQRKISKSNSSGYRGVGYDKRRLKWRSRIKVDKDIHIGYFNTKEEAAIAYDSYVIEHKLEHTRNFR